MKVYQKPVLDLELFEAEDILTASSLTAEDLGAGIGVNFSDLIVGI